MDALIAMTLVRPTRAHLASYVAALERGWSADNIRGKLAADEELRCIAADGDGFLAALEDREAAGPPLTLLDGTRAARIPGFRRWMWDDEFCGSIGLRWQPGTEALPPHCLGHIGYAVVPWKRNRGYATRALADMLREASTLGLRYVDLTTDPDNVASQRVILANGGTFVEEFIAPPGLGSKREWRYRIVIDPQALPSSPERTSSS